MADAVVQTGVKTESPASAAPAKVQEVKQGQPPATENVAPATGSPESRVPYTRFQEVIREKNEFASRINELEKRLQVQEVAIGARAKVDVASKHIDKLVAAGMDRGAAEVLLDSAAGLVEDKIKQRVDPLQQAVAAQESQQWTKKFSEQHGDFADQEKKMYEVYTGLPEYLQAALASHPIGVELLYSQAKQSSTAEDIHKAQEEGAKGAYETKGLKQAMSPQSGASAAPQTGFTREGVANMSLEEYSKNRKAIFDAMVQKKRLG